MKKFTNCAVGNKKMKNLFTLLFIAGLFLLAGCGGAKSGGDPEDLNELRELVENRNFEIENEWALPMGGGSINLIGNPNHIRVKGDSVDIFLPYFGVRHTGGGYGREGGIKYEGAVEDFSITENPQQENILVTFEVQKDTETFNFSIRLYPGGNAQTSVNSSQRNVIGYRGHVEPLEDQPE